MKVGRSIVSLISKTTSITQPSDQLARLAASIEGVTKSLSKKDAQVDEIVSYQADMVFTSPSASKAKELKNEKEVEVEVEDDISKQNDVLNKIAAAPKVSIEKPKSRSSLLKKLLVKKTPPSA